MSHFKANSPNYIRGVCPYVRLLDGVQHFAPAH